MPGEQREVINPYASPLGIGATADTVSVDREYLEAVERRLKKLEERIQNHWMLSPRFLVRSLAVFFYWIVGYALVAIPIFGAILLLELFFRR
jgi:hypothetical protein